MCDNNISNESYCSGGGGTDLTWIDPYLIEQPPAIVYGPNNPLTVGDTIYIPWYYPSQINVGFMGNNLPLILSFSSNLVTDSGTFPIVSSQSTGFINNYYTGVTGAVTGIAITSNTFITNGIYSYNGNNYYYFNYLNAGINLTTVSNIISWYQNYSTLEPNMSISSSFFIAGSSIFTPSPALTVGATGLTTTSNITITYTGATGATNYQIGYSNSYPLSAIRYSGAAPLSANTATAIVNTVAPYNTVPLYPDTKYTASISARDNTTTWSSAVTSAIVTTGTSLSNIVGLSSASVITFPNITPKVGKKVSDNSTIFIINPLPTISQTSNPFLIPIHTLGTRGQSGSLMTLTTGSGLTINYTGFPATVPAPSSLNNITITTNKVTDNYVNSYEQGFFLNANVSVTLDTAFFTGTPTLTLTQNFTGGPSGQSTSLTFNTSDGTVGNPVFSADTIQAFGTYKQVSNIWSIVQDPINFTFNSTDVTNMGTYYYNDPLVNYSVLVENDPVYYKCQTSGISDVTSSTSGGTFHYPMAITSSTGVTTSNSSYGTTFTVIPTYNNINGSTTGTQQTLITNIDYASNANININKIPDITFNNSIIGCRIYSGSPSTLYLTNNASPYTNYPIHTVPTYLYSSQQYANIIYQNSWDITQTAISFTPATGSPITVDATSELLMARGQYTTPSSIPNAYKNYRTYNYYNSTPKVNGSDYSGVSNTGYRYATFAWNIPIDGGTQGYNYLTFNINGIDTSQVVYQYVPITIGPSYSRLRFYYRFEQLNSPLPTDATSYSSIWSDANNLISGSATNSSVAGLTFGNGNYFGTSNVLPNEIYTGYLYQHSPTFSPTFTTVPEHNTTLTFQVSCPNIAPVRTSNIYVYCRIGLPMNCDFTFSNVTATFTNI